jgi:WD40 repeat protein
MDSNDLCICELEECRLYLNNPIMLPCGSTICQNHVDQNEKEKHKCSICQEDHPIPENGFPLNKAIIKIIANGCHLKHSHRNILDSIQRFDDFVKLHESFDSFNLIYNFFSNLRNQVDLHRDQLTEKINEKSDKILSELKIQEEIFKKNAQNLKTINLDELKEQKLEWLTKSRNPYLERNDLNTLTDHIVKTNQTIKNEIELLEKNSLMKTNIDFVPIDSSSFGVLYTYPNLIKYSALLGQPIKKFNHEEINLVKVDDKSKIIITSTDTNVIIYDYESCLSLRSFQQKKCSQILTTNSKRFITCSEEKIIKVWDLNFGYKRLKTINAISQICSICLISDDEIACSFKDGTINIWNIVSSIKIKSIKANDGEIKLLKLSLDSKKLIFATLDYVIKVLDYKSIQLTQEIQVHSSIVSALEFNSNGNLMSGSIDKTIKIWNIENGEMLKSIEFETQINCIKLIIDNIIVIGTGNYFNNNILIFDLNRETILRSFSPRIGSYIRDLIYLPNGNLITLIGDELKMWNFLDLC